MYSKTGRPMLYNTLIEKGIIFDQVWKIYNESIPMTEKQHDLKKDSGNYVKDKKRENIEFNINYDKTIKNSDGVQKETYISKKETEQQARIRYEYFKDNARKDLKAVLEKLNSPLIFYDNLKKTPQIPVIVAAVFAAIADLKKYGSLSPSKMAELSGDEDDETIQMFLLQTKSKKYERYDYFIMRVVENLKYFFNIAPQLDETNLGVIRKFDYEIIEVKSHYLIQRKKGEKTEKETIEDKQGINLNAIAAEIENFRNEYINAVNEKQDENRKMRKVFDLVQKMLMNYSREKYWERINVIEEAVQFLDCHNDDKVSLVVLLDFADEPFRSVHEILGKKSSDDFYKKRLEMKKEESVYLNAVSVIIKELETVDRMVHKESKNIINAIRKNI
jgi:hypothetical protein